MVCNCASKHTDTCERRCNDRCETPEILNLLEKAVNLGKSQADEMDRFWAAIDCLGGEISIDQAIERWKALEEENRKLWIIVNNGLGPEDLKRVL